MSDFNKPKIHVSLKENKFHIKVFKKKSETDSRILATPDPGDHQSDISNITVNVC